MELYTPDEAASILKLTPYTIRRLLREGKLPGIKIGAGQLWRIRKDELEAYLTKQDVPRGVAPQSEHNRSKQQ